MNSTIKNTSVPVSISFTIPVARTIRVSYTHGGTKYNRVMSRPDNLAKLLQGISCQQRKVTLREITGIQAIT